MQTKKYDGIHMYGPSGMKSYTASVLNILSAAQLVLATPPRYYDEYNHHSCDQARYQDEQMNRNQENRTQNSKWRTHNMDNRKYESNHGQQFNIVQHNQQYSVPTQNRYNAKLGDFPQKNV